MTPTPIPIYSLSKQASASSATSGDLVDYTLSLYLSAPSGAGAAVTDELPADVTFKSFLQSPAGATAVQTGQTLTWTLPNLPAGTYTFQYGVVVNNFLMSGENLVNHAAFTSPSLPLLSASATVLVTGQYTVEIGVYNGAGELIATLPAIQMTQPVQSLSASATVIQSLGGVIQVYFDGLLLGQWNGNTSSGTPATNGTYFFKAENIDTLGIVTTTTLQVQVNRSLSKVSMEVFNEAGEVVRNLYTTIAAPVSVEMAAMSLSTNSFNPYSSTLPTGTVLTVTDTLGGAVTLTWDGRDDNGNVVTTGRYFLSVHWIDGEGGEQTLTNEVAVMDQGVPSGLVSAWPNILKGPGATTLFVTSQPGLTLHIQIYDLAGELVGKVDGAAGTSQAGWTADKVASGIYLAVVELKDASGNKVARQALKLMVAH